MFDINQCIENEIINYSEFVSLIYKTFQNNSNFGQIVIHLMCLMNLLNCCVNYDKLFILQVNEIPIESLYFSFLLVMVRYKKLITLKKRFWVILLNLHLDERDENIFYEILNYMKSSHNSSNKLLNDENNSERNLFEKLSFDSTKTPFDENKSYYYLKNLPFDNNLELNVILREDCDMLNSTKLSNTPTKNIGNPNAYENNARNVMNQIIQIYVDQIHSKISNHLRFWCDVEKLYNIKLTRNSIRFIGNSNDKDDQNETTNNFNIKTQNSNNEAYKIQQEKNIKNSIDPNELNVNNNINNNTMNAYENMENYNENDLNSSIGKNDDFITSRNAFNTEHDKKYTVNEFTKNEDLINKINSNSYQSLSNDQIYKCVKKSITTKSYHRNLISSLLLNSINKKEVKKSRSKLNIVQIMTVLMCYSVIGKYQNYPAKIDKNEKGKNKRKRNKNKNTEKKVKRKMIKQT